MHQFFLDPSTPIRNARYAHLEEASDFFELITHGMLTYQDGQVLDELVLGPQFLFSQHENVGDFGARAEEAKLWFLSILDGAPYFEVLPLDSVHECRTSQDPRALRLVVPRGGFAADPREDELRITAPAFLREIR